MKPGLGVVSQAGIVPIAASQDAAWPLTRTVEDAAVVLSAIATRPVDYRSGLNKGGLRRQRLGVLRAPFTGYSEHTDRCYDESLKALKACGAILVEVEFPTARELRESDVELTILLHEFRTGLNRYLDGRTGLAVKTLADVIRWNRRHATAEMPYFRQELLEKSAATRTSKPVIYREARKRALRLARDEGIDRVLREHRIHALVAPSGAPAWVIDQIDGDRHLGGA